MRAIDVMTRRVVKVAPEAAVEEAVRLMLGHRINGLPVVGGDGRLVGIVSEGDLLRRLEPQRPRWRELFAPPSQPAEERAGSRRRRVEDVMTRAVVAVGELTGLAEIADLLEAKHIRQVPVLRNQRLVGIVGRADLLQALTRGAAAADAAADLGPRDRRPGELRRQRWTRPAAPDIIVADGAEGRATARVHYLA